MINELNDLKICSDLSSNLAKLVGSKEILDNFSHSPKDVMEYALSHTRDELKNDFASQIGLWEGFTLGEHTESVMTFFEENFVDTLACSKSTRAIMNLIIFCHDIGKAEEKRKELSGHIVSPIEKFELYNIKTLKFFEDLKLESQKNAQLALFITNITQKLELATTSYYVRGNDYALEILDDFAKNLLKENDFDCSTPNIDALSTIARVLQTCDSGAYTTYGKTRNTITNLYRPNLNKEWTKGFILTKEGYRFKKDAPKKEFVQEQLL